MCAVSLAFNYVEHKCAGSGLIPCCWFLCVSLFLFCGTRWMAAPVRFNPPGTAGIQIQNVDWGAYNERLIFDFELYQPSGILSVVSSPEGSAIRRSPSDYIFSNSKPHQTLNMHTWLLGTTLPWADNEVFGDYINGDVVNIINPTKIDSENSWNSALNSKQKEREYVPLTCAESNQGASVALLLVDALYCCTQLWTNSCDQSVAFVFCSSVGTEDIRGDFVNVKTGGRTQKQSRRSKKQCALLPQLAMGKCPRRSAVSYRREAICGNHDVTVMPYGYHRRSESTCGHHEQKHGAGIRIG